MTTENIFNLFIILPVILFSVIIHENAHGLMALALGDKTAKNAGRLTLNPLRHLDPFGSIILPMITSFAFGFPLGYAKPVPINPMYFNNQRSGMVYTSLAGPLSNLGLAVIGSFFLKIVVLDSIVLTTFIVINVILAIFNLIPIPPLDGSKVVAGLIPRKWLGSYYRFESYGMVIVLITMIFFREAMWQFIYTIVRPMLEALGVSY